MKVLFNGLPLFAKRLVQDLQRMNPESTFLFFDTYNSRWGKFKFLFHLINADCVISFNGVSDESGSLDWVLKFRKKLILQWMGTDISIAVERNKNHSIVKKYIDYSSANFVDAPWMKEELKSADVNAEILHFKYVPELKPVQKYEEISIVSYIPEQRQDFYGLKEIIAAAREFPQYRFDLFGLSKSIYDIPENIILHGWCTSETFLKHLRESPILIRIPEHDGFSVTVLEAMGLGCEVIWTYPEKGIIHLSNRTGLKSAIQLALERVQKREMKPNEELSHYANNQFNKDKILKNYYQKLNEIVG